MLRVGLTGGLGSGKSTAARRFAELGAQVLSADEIARDLMRPGEAVYLDIVKQFGQQVVAAHGQLDRAALARIAFGDGPGPGGSAGRIEELNAIVHPATIARQAELTAQIGARDPNSVVIVESALVFETAHGGGAGWRSRFDRIILVRASEETRLARFVARASGVAANDPAGLRALEEDGRRRMSRQLDDDAKARQSDYVIWNEGTLEELTAQVDAFWPRLRDAAREGL